MDRSQAHLLLERPLAEVIAEADSVRRGCVGSRLELCSILNAKSGRCPEDCKFCAQSGRHRADIQSYPLKSKEEILKSAQRAKEIGAEKFGIVTSGNRLSAKEIGVVAESAAEIKEKIGIDVCASCGSLDKPALKKLKEAGVVRYHHNIETSRCFYPNIVSTHSFEDRIRTIEAAKEAGLKVCSGGIIGMGEEWADRIDMAFELKRLGVDSVPINMLVPIKGTALEAAGPISCCDAVRAICIFRIVLRDKVIKIAAGRESVFKDFQAMGFMAGANGMLIGGYLTIAGRPVEDDRKLAEEIIGLWSR